MKFFHLWFWFDWIILKVELSLITQRTQFLFYYCFLWLIWQTTFCDIVLRKIYWDDTHWNVNIAWFEKKHINSQSFYQSLRNNIPYLLPWKKRNKKRKKYRCWYLMDGRCKQWLQPKLNLGIIMKYYFC